MSLGFIEKAIKVHGDTYDYSLVEYKTMKIKVKILCKTHGVFEQTPNNHVHVKSGCPKCFGNDKLTTTTFIERAKLIHGDTYDYSLVDYININKKVTITCKNHGNFVQTPSKHLNTNGCLKCTSKSYSKLSLKWFNSLNITNLRTVLYPEGEFTIPGSLYKADGYCEETNTVYEFHGDYWHGNPKIFNPNELNKSVGKTFGELYENTLRKKEYILSLGFKYIEIWESDFKT
jgi:hypothetical protein